LLYQLQAASQQQQQGVSGGGMLSSSQPPSVQQQQHNLVQTQQQQQQQQQSFVQPGGSSLAVRLDGGGYVLVPVAQASPPVSLQYQPQQQHQYQLQQPQQQQHQQLQYQLTTASALPSQQQHVQGVVQQQPASIVGGAASGVRQLATSQPSLAHLQSNPNVQGFPLSRLGPQHAAQIRMLPTAGGVASPTHTSAPAAPLVERMPGHDAQTTVQEIDVPRLPPGMLPGLTSNDALLLIQQLQQQQQQQQQASHHSQVMRQVSLSSLNARLLPQHPDGGVASMGSGGGVDGGGGGSMLPSLAAPGASIQPPDSILQAISRLSVAQQQQQQASAIALQHQSQLQSSLAPQAQAAMPHPSMHSQVHQMHAEHDQGCVDAGHQVSMGVLQVPDPAAAALSRTVVPTDQAHEQAAEWQPLQSTFQINR
jgi:hypothetical protein